MFDVLIVSAVAAQGPVVVAVAARAVAPVRFKFNAGATQAVRRTAYVKDFL